MILQSEWLRAIRKHAHVREREGQARTYRIGEEFRLFCLYLVHDVASFASISLSILGSLSLERRFHSIWHFLMPILDFISSMESFNSFRFSLCVRGKFSSVCWFRRLHLQVRVAASAYNKYANFLHNFKSDAFVDFVLRLKFSSAAYTASIRCVRESWAVHRKRVSISSEFNCTLSNYPPMACWDIFACRIVSFAPLNVAFF